MSPKMDTAMHSPRSVSILQSPKSFSVSEAYSTKKMMRNKSRGRYD